MKTESDAGFANAIVVVVKLEKHVADKNRQLIPQWSAFTYANMYGVKFEQVSQRNCLFCGKLSEKPTLLSDRGHL